MGKSRIHIAKEFIEGVKLRRGRKLKTEDFLYEIENHIGADKLRTMKPYIELMQKHNLIIEVGEEVELK